MQDAMLAGTAMPRDARLILLGSCVAMLGVGENSTAVMAALPAMSIDLGLSPAAVEWVVRYRLQAFRFLSCTRAPDGFGTARRGPLAAVTQFVRFSSFLDKRVQE